MLGIQSTPSTQYKSTYLKQLVEEQDKIDTELESFRESREKYPAWNTLKSGFWFTSALLSHTVQITGSFLGHVVTAVVVAPLATVAGTVYATGMKAFDYATGRENTKTFLDYTLSVVQTTCNLTYNRATDWLCKYILGPTLIFSVVPPAVCMIISAIGCFGACPFYHWDFKYNQSRYVEFMERHLMMNISTMTNLAIWDNFLNLKGTDVLEGLNNFWSGKKKTPESLLKPLNKTPVKPNTLRKDIEEMLSKQGKPTLPSLNEYKLRTGDSSVQPGLVKQRLTIPKKEITKLRPLGPKN